MKQLLPKKYLTRNWILLTTLLALLLLVSGYKYKIDTFDLQNQEQSSKKHLNDKFLQFGVEEAFPSTGYITGLTSIPKLTWYNLTIKQIEPDIYIDVSYPKFIGDASVQKLNDYIFDIVNRNIEEGKKIISTPSEDRPNNKINLTSIYKVVGVNNGIVSIDIVLTDFTGGGNGNHDNAITINWDLKSGRLFKNEELFCNKDYIEKLIPLVRKSIIKQFVGNEDSSYTLPQEAISWIERGTEDEDDNWKNFLVVKNGLVVVFQPYQISSGASGVVRVFIDKKDIPNLICLPKAKDVSSSDIYEIYPNTPYQFKNFPVNFNPYKVAEVKFESDFKLRDNPNYWNDWESIFGDIKNSEYDFAGHYKIIGAANGTMKNLYLVDGLTGQISEPEGMIAAGPSTYIYKNNSKLFILVMDNSYGFVPQTIEKTVYFYYTLNDDKSFNLLGAYVYKDSKFIKVDL